MAHLIFLTWYEHIVKMNKMSYFTKIKVNSTGDHEAQSEGTIKWQ